jgi:hypothetical protein
VLTRHLLADDVESTESAFSERDIFQRDMDWLCRADLLIADASGSSYGVGFEVGYVLGRAEHSRQRVLLLFDTARRDRVSRLIAGNAHPRCTTYAYRSAEELQRAVEDFVAAPVADR